MDYSISENILKDFYIPNYILLPESEVRDASHMPASPVLVFINSRSGGQLGGELLCTYRVLLNKNQVFDLDKEAPDKVLHQFYFNIEKLKHMGDILASEIQNRLRIIVAGGDGTANWLLGVVSDLKLPRPPPIATVPLGTGNNLPFSFGWGKKNPGSDRQSVESFLDQVRTAREMKIDSWHITLRMRPPEEGSCDPGLVLPHSLHAFHHVYPTEKLNIEGCHTFQGGFWNYFSMGMDAQVSYAFHSERKLHPDKFKNQLVNQSIYAKLACKQGSFWTSMCYPSSWNIAKLTKVRIMKKQGQWEELPIPYSIRSIICLNLPSFSGGLNPWGMPSRNALRNSDFTPPFVDDGVIEVVGFRDAWHGLCLYAPRGHGTRLAQVKRIRFEFHKSKAAANHVFMRIDGEPWKQPLPVDDDDDTNPVVVEISHLGQVSVLATPHCRSRSITESSSLVTHLDMEEDSTDTEEPDMPRKFGAADTFRMPDNHFMP